MDIVIRAVVMFLFVWLVTRAVGRRELSTLEPFDLILLVVIGDLIQQSVTQNDFSVTGGMLAVGTFAAMTVLFSSLAFRFPRVQPVLEGDPVILVERGKTIDRNLRMNRITHEELAELVGLDHRRQLTAVEVEQADDEGRAALDPRVRLDAAEPKLPVDGGHHCERTAVGLLPHPRAVVDLPARQPLEAQLDRLDHLGGCEQLCDLGLRQIERHGRRV